MEQHNPVPIDRPSQQVLVLAVLIAAVPTLIKFLCYPGYIGGDDSYIHLQVVQNLLAHHNWAINPGHPVNISTAPLFTLLLAGIMSLFHSSGILATVLASAMACAIGLLAIFLHIWHSTGGNRLAAFFGLGSLAFASNLWRWNGTVMETTFAFCAAAMVVFLLHRQEITNRRCIAGSALLGLSVLLRPELMVLAILTIAFRVFSQRSNRTVQTFVLIVGFIAPLAFWVAFAYHTFGSLLPSTLSAKTSEHLIFFNYDLVKEYAQLVVLSLFWPAVAFIVCLAILRGNIRTLHPSAWASLATALLISGFYYFRTPGLESPGRYLLLLFPFIAVVAAQWVAQATSARPAFPWKALILSALALHLLMCMAVNARFIQPALVSFQGEYFATTCNAANNLAALSSPDTRVLVEIDIGVLSYCGNGHFFIEDGGGLASPQLAHLSVGQQIDAVRPAFIVESQGPTLNYLGQSNPQLHEIWHNAYRGHGVSSPQKLFMNVYVVQPSP